MPIKLNEIIVDLEILEGKDEMEQDINICSLCGDNLQLNSQYNPIEHTLDICLNNILAILKNSGAINESR